MRDYSHTRDERLMACLRIAVPIIALVGFIAVSAL